MAQQKYVISSEVWGVYEEYLRRIDNGNRPGAFAITEDGYGAFYVWCDAIRCMAGATYSQEAINNCEREYDTDCVTFAVRDDIRVTYEVAAAEPADSTYQPDAPVQSNAPAISTITITAAVKAEIDDYLAHTQDTTRAWALAIAQDGSEVGRASCPANYGLRGGGACAPIKGAPQELANREAILSCGGAASCTLLYEGAEQKADVEIVVQ
jgi:hypothetical protein